MRKRDSKSEPTKTAAKEDGKGSPRKVRLLTLEELKGVTGGTCDSNGPPRRGALFQSVAF